jgi:hypothetical protein
MTSTFLIAFPNPFSETINVTVEAERAGNCTISIKDINGRTVASRAAALSQGANSIRVDGLYKLAQGIYQVVADINGNVRTTTLVK